jgi:hypothetical protein
VYGKKMNLSPGGIWRLRKGRGRNWVLERNIMKMMQRHLKVRVVFCDLRQREIADVSKVSSGEKMEAEYATTENVVEITEAVAVELRATHGDSIAVENTMVETTLTTQTTAEVQPNEGKDFY